MFKNSATAECLDCHVRVTISTNQQIMPGTPDETDTAMGVYAIPAGSLCPQGHEIPDFAWEIRNSA